MVFIIGKRKRMSSIWDAIKKKWSGRVYKRKRVPLKSGYYRKSGLMKYSGKSELKFFDTTLATTAITTAGVVINNTLNAMVEGSDYNNRIGRKCTVTRIHLRGTLTLPSQTNITLMSVSTRVILYLDRQCNASAATVAAILQTADEKSFNLLENSERFVILKDWYIVQNVVSNTVLAGMKKNNNIGRSYICISCCTK